LGIWGLVFSMQTIVLTFDTLILPFIHDFSTDQRPLLECNDWDIGLSAMRWRVLCLRGQMTNINRNHSSEADFLSHCPVVASLVHNHHFFNFKSTKIFKNHMQLTAFLILLVHIIVVWSYQCKSTHVIISSLDFCI